MNYVRVFILSHGGVHAIMNTYMLVKIRAPQPGAALAVTTVGLPCFVDLIICARAVSDNILRLHCFFLFVRAGKLKSSSLTSNMAMSTGKLFVIASRY